MRCQKVELVANNPLLSCTYVLQELGLESKTVMALTRTDRVTPAEFDDMVLDRIFMRSSEFPRPLFACIAIVNRTSDDTVTLAEHQAMEEQWFEWCVAALSGSVV